MGNNTYSLVRDMKLLKLNFDAYPNAISYDTMFRNEMGTEKLPEVCGRLFMGQVFLNFTNAEQL